MVLLKYDLTFLRNEKQNLLFDAIMIYKCDRLNRQFNLELKCENKGGFLCGNESRVNLLVRYLVLKL